MASGSSGSSYTTSSSQNYPASYRQAQTSPLDPTWTPTTRSTASALTSGSSLPPNPSQTPLRPLDLGPPGYQATITLFERTTDEITVYLGPWDIETPGVDYRCLSWQCSYQGEVLEHYLPSSIAADIVPISLHAHHRPFEATHDMELYLTFDQPHRVRYRTSDGVTVHNAVIAVKYVFATFEGSLRFQGDLRGRDLLDFFDMDVVWTDREGRTDAFGAVRGVATGQRMKLWKDRYGSYHTITFLARDRRFREYPISAFEAEIRGADERHRRLRLSVAGPGPRRRGSGQESTSGSSTRRMSLSSFRPRRSSADAHAGGSSSSHGTGQSSSSRHHHHPQDQVQSAHGLNFRYLGMQFTRTADFTRFMQQWDISYAEDSSFNGIPFPSTHYELPSPEMLAGDPSELPGESYAELDTVPEPPDGEDDDTVMR